MADVFITYAPADAELALRIQKSLERAGITASRGPLQFTPAWPARLLDELDACVAVVALWSAAAMRVDWVATEAAVGAHFGQTVSVRTDPALDLNAIPDQFRTAPGAEITDLFENDIAPGGWGQNAAEMLDRKLAPVFGRIRALKTRGPVAVQAAASGAVVPAEEAQRRLSGGFGWTRHAGDRPGRSMPALAATRREAAFRSAYNALAGMDYPSDIRAGLADFGDGSTARRGLARIYAEALSRNDREFWGLLGRLAAPLSTGLCVAGLQRSGAPATVVGDLTDPRDVRDLHDERFGRVRSRGASGGGGLVMWPIAAVAVGLALVVAGPQLHRIAPDFSIASLMPKFPKVEQQVASATEVAPPPWANGAQTVRARPLASPPVILPPVIPPPVSTGTRSIAAATPPPPASMPVTVPALPVSATLDATGAPLRLRYCRLNPSPNEIVVEVMEGERLFDVAGRVFMDSPAGIAQIARRNSACLEPRALLLGDGRTLMGSDLIFRGDRLVVPAQKTDSASSLLTNTAL